MKTSPAGMRAEMVDASCETLLTSSNFDFDSGRVTIDRTKLNNFFNEGKEIIPNKKVSDFSIEFPIPSPDLKRRPGVEGADTSPHQSRPLSLGITLPSPKKGEIESLSKRSSPRLEMLPDIELAEEMARSQLSKRPSDSKKSKKHRGLRLSLQIAPNDSDKLIHLTKDPPPRRVKPLNLNDSWDDLKPIKASSYQVKRGLLNNANKETSDIISPELADRANSLHSSKSIHTSSSSGNFFSIDTENSQAQAEHGDISPTRRFPSPENRPDPAYRRSSVRKVSQQGNRSSIALFESDVNFTKYFTKAINREDSQFYTPKTQRFKSFFAGPGQHPQGE
jgi:hypothetical protein